MKSKVCPVCHAEKPADAFGIRKRDGLLRSHCKACSAVKARAYYQRNPEKVRAAARAWRKANPDVLRARKAAHIAANPERHKAQRKAARVRHRESTRAYMDKYRAENAERLRAQMRGRYYETREERAAYAAEYRIANPDRISKARRAYRTENLEREKAQSAEWRRLHPEHSRAAEAKRRARKQRAPGNGVSTSDVRQLHADSLGLCAYCNGRMELTMDHIEPLVKGGAHDVANLAAACRPCNSSKNETPLLLWFAKRANLRAAA